jgi:hypothetical protein
MLFTFEATDDQKKQPKLKKKERERERETRQCGEGKQWRQQAFLLPSFMVSWLSRRTPCIRRVN